MSEPSSASALQTSPTGSSPSWDSRSSKPQRVLACVRCQQRKIKCDRRLPCAHCIKSSCQCIPSTLAPRSRRRRRFPERELLDRLRKYEGLLRQNNINFEPLHKDAADSPLNQDGYESEGQHSETVTTDSPSSSVTIKTERVFEPKNFWNSLNSGYRDPNNEDDSPGIDMVEEIVKTGWIQMNGNNDHLLFGSSSASIDLSTLHPEPVQIFRLWQIYLDNVNPLLKVTHTTSLQGRIIEAVSNVSTISAPLESLMFSIYSMAILSLNADECQTAFGSTRDELLTRFQFGCQQALTNCGYLRSSDLDCLTALFLYLVSVRSRTVPQSLSAMLGVAIRIAQRMGIHSESVLSRCTPLEAELRRRLWWSLALFDTRISEMAGHKNATIAPTWDCKIPLNVNDSDLRAEMKEPPDAQGLPTDALFAVVRGELGEFIRHTSFYLDFTSPALKPIVKTSQQNQISEATQLDALEKMMEEKYLKFCDSENPLHFMTIWWTRAYLARCRFMEHHARNQSSCVPQTDIQRDAAISHALRMLECDTEFKSSPLTNRFIWLLQVYFPAPAYIQIIQDLRRRPCSSQAERAWEVMSENFDRRFQTESQASDSLFLRIFAKIVLDAWDAREKAYSQSGHFLAPPRMVICIKQKILEREQNEQTVDIQLAESVLGRNIDQFAMPFSTGTGNHGILFNLGEMGGYDAPSRPLMRPHMLGHPPPEVEVNSFDWAAMNWGFGGLYTGF